jgi:hypothetical protein
VNALDDWNNLKEVTKLAVGQLLDQLQSETSTQDLLDSYLYAKRLLAESMQAFIRVDLTESSETFNDLREQIRAAIDRRYAGRIPDRYLKVPYGSRVHEELFAILLQRQGIPVQAALLRVVTGDSVHTERRVRELRELGLDVQTSKESGYDYYTLGSLNVDMSFVPVIVANQLARPRRAAILWSAQHVRAAHGMPPQWRLTKAVAYCADTSFRMSAKLSLPYSRRARC